MLSAQPIASSSESRPARSRRARPRRSAASARTRSRRGTPSARRRSRSRSASRSRAGTTRAASGSRRRAGARPRARRARRRSPTSRARGSRATRRRRPCPAARRRRTSRRASARRDRRTESPTTRRRSSRPYSMAGILPAAILDRCCARSSSTSTSRSRGPARSSVRRGTGKVGERHGLALDPDCYESARLAALESLQRHPDHVHDDELWIAFTEQIVRGMGGEGDGARAVRRRARPRLGAARALHALRGRAAGARRAARARRQDRPDLERQPRPGGVRRPPRRWTPTASSARATSAAPSRTRRSSGTRWRCSTSSPRRPR